MVLALIYRPGSPWIGFYALLTACLVKNIYESLIDEALIPTECLEKCLCV